MLCNPSSPNRSLACLPRISPQTHFPHFPSPLHFTSPPSLYAPLSFFSAASSILCWPMSSLLLHLSFTSGLLLFMSPFPLISPHFIFPSLHSISSPSLHIFSFTPILSLTPYLLPHSISSPSLYVSSGPLPFVRPLFLQPSGVDVWRMPSVACVIREFLSLGKVLRILYVLNCLPFCKEIRRGLLL